MVSWLSLYVGLLVLLGVAMGSPSDHVFDPDSQINFLRVGRASGNDGWQYNEQRDKNGRLLSRDYSLQHTSDDFDSHAFVHEEPGKKKSFRIGGTFRF